MKLNIYLLVGACAMLAACAKEPAQCHDANYLCPDGYVQYKEESREIGVRWVIKCQQKKEQSPPPAGHG